MSKNDFVRLIKSLDQERVAPQGLREKMLQQILTEEGNHSTPSISNIERMIFEKPLRFTGVVSTAISVILWAIMGKGYISILSGLIGIR